MSGEAEHLRAYVEYFRDLGVHDFYRRGEPVVEASAVEQVSAPVAEALPVTAHPVPEKVAVPSSAEHVVAVPVRPAPTPISSSRSEFLEPPNLKLVSFNNLAPLPEKRMVAADRPAALRAIQEEIGDCTRCPLAYAGRHKIVFADGDPSARLMFVGEGPGADEDAQGLPFVGKAGQLLNNMIGAMGLKREQVYIANIVKCRPPGNRTPEPVEATTCSQFLLKQIDVVQPEFIVALGSTAATYLLGVKQSLAGLRGRWHSCRGAKLAVTYHPAFLLRDPRQKAEAWKDLQMVMKEMGLKVPSKG
ncbi:uracil-DNA glycosylase [Edaphobacter flagellatus]|uniref:uracil-DNA glycosylase n=1 Tax=Edaphobacter flagellatus TaxID=1933044 RepID=UPI0021B2888F|nr:uracil-DNA glycosylase [Edaphobacter flagellatus]